MVRDEMDKIINTTHSIKSKKGLSIGVTKLHQEHIWSLMVLSLETEYITILLWFPWSIIHPIPGKIKIQTHYAALNFEGRALNFPLSQSISLKPLGYKKVFSDITRPHLEPQKTLACGASGSQTHDAR